MPIMSIWRWSWFVFGLCACVCGAVCLWTIFGHKDSSVPIMAVAAVLVLPALFWLYDRLRRRIGMRPLAYVGLIWFQFRLVGGVLVHGTLDREAANTQAVTANCVGRQAGNLFGWESGSGGTRADRGVRPTYFAADRAEFPASGHLYREDFSVAASRGVQ